MFISFLLKMILSAFICNLKYDAKDEELLKLFRMSGKKTEFVLV